MTCVRLNPPVWLIFVFYYGSIVISLALCLVLSPIILLYWLFLCWRVRTEWRSTGKDVLTVFAETPSSEHRMEQILPLVTSRSEFLNWSKRDGWNRWSIAPHIFRFYSFLGPPPFRLKSCLPVVFVFRRFYWPTTFSFGGSRTTEAQVIDMLKQELQASSKPIIPA